MHLTVKDPADEVIAEVDAAADCSFAQKPGEPPGFVIGHFTPGPAYETVARMLRRFLAIANSGDAPAAFAGHDQIDALGLRAIDERGNTYRVFNVHFQQGALLFAAVR